MTHPGLCGEALWFGPEAEGPLRGVRTAFVARPLSPDQQRALSRAAVAHIFVCETFRDYRWLRENADLFLAAPYLTLAAEQHTLHDVVKVRDSVFPKAKVCLHVWISGVAVESVNLVTVGNPYDLVTLNMASGVRTLPQDYAEDALS